MSVPKADPDPDPKPARRSWRRRLGRALVLYVVVPYVAACVIFFALQRKFLYPATRATTAIRAAAAGLAVERVRDVQVSTRDGLTLHGWLLRASTDAAGAARERPLLVLCFPGNSGNRLDRVIDCREFSQLGCDVLLVDYRGYGENAGSPGEERIASDAERVWQYATGELAYGADRVVIFGESIGGAVAVRLAAELCEAGTPPAGLVLSSTFAALPETVRWHYPYFPFHWLLLDRYPSAERIPGVTCPVLQFHGTRDDFVPLDHARRLFAAAPAWSSSGVPKRFFEVAGGGHNDLPVGAFRGEMLDFLAGLGHHRAGP